ncbi:MAG TPA: VTC domain-containing protein [Vicinamibacterales bacterium]|nr:VTC domain-containing protein [Vicinamibacterales bacterium]
MSTVVAAARPLSGLERELKYVISAGKALLARSTVAAICVPDSRYPAAIVSTIYYDTPDLELLSEKINSDYLKTKVRLRWYSSSPGSARAFLEIKSRVGALRHKLRTETALTADELRDLPLEHPALVTVLDSARPLGVGLPARLMPALLLRYERFRFVEPVSGSRISVDAGIEAVRGNPQLLGHAFQARLPLAVVEVKGRDDDLPVALRPLVRLGARRASCSKYGLAGAAMLRYTP